MPPPSDRDVRAYLAESRKQIGTAILMVTGMVLALGGLLLDLALRIAALFNNRPRARSFTFGPGGVQFFPGWPAPEHFASIAFATGLFLLLIGIWFTRRANARLQRVIEAIKGPTGDASPTSRGPGSADRRIK